MILDDADVTLYAPDVGDNRARHAAGDPAAVVVEVRGASAILWRRYLQALHRRSLQNGQGPTDDEIEGLLFTGCIGAIRGLTRQDGTPILTGTGLWALRDAVKDRLLLNDLFGEIHRLSQVDEALAGNSAPGSGSAGSIAATPGMTGGGTVAPAAAAD